MLRQQSVSSMKKRPARGQARADVEYWPEDSVLQEAEIERVFAGSLLAHAQRISAGPQAIAVDHDFERDGRRWKLAVEGADRLDVLLLFETVERDGVMGAGIEQSHDLHAHEAALQLGRGIHATHEGEAHRGSGAFRGAGDGRSEEHTSELQSPCN